MLSPIITTTSPSLKKNSPAVAGNARKTARIRPRQQPREKRVVERMLFLREERRNAGQFVRRLGLHHDRLGSLFQGRSRRTLTRTSEVLDVKMAAELLTVSPDTVYDPFKRGELPGRKVGRK